MFNALNEILNFQSFSFPFFFLIIFVFDNFSHLLSHTDQIQNDTINVCPVLIRITMAWCMDHSLVHSQPEQQTYATRYSSSILVPLFKWEEMLKCVVNLLKCKSFWFAYVCIRTHRLFFGHEFAHSSHPHTPKPINVSAFVRFWLQECCVYVSVANLFAQKYKHTHEDRVCCVFPFKLQIYLNFEKIILVFVFFFCSLRWALPLYYNPLVCFVNWMLFGRVESLFAEENWRMMVNAGERMNSPSHRTKKNGPTQRSAIKIGTLYAHLGQTTGANKIKKLSEEKVSRVNFPIWFRVQCVWACVCVLL